MTGRPSPVGFHLLRSRELRGRSSRRTRSRAFPQATSRCRRRRRRRRRRRPGGRTGWRTTGAGAGGAASGGRPSLRTRRRDGGHAPSDAGGRPFRRTRRRDGGHASSRRRRRGKGIRAWAAGRYRRRCRHPTLGRRGSFHGGSKSPASFSGEQRRAARAGAAGCRGTRPPHRRGAPRRGRRRRPLSRAAWSRARAPAVAGAAPPGRRGEPAPVTA